MNSKQYFNEVARQWDKMRSGFFSESLREKTLSFAGIQSGKVAADIGAGTGFITEGLVRDGLQVIAVDASEIMLETMRKKFCNIKDVDCRMGEAERLPIVTDSVDYVFANMYLHHVEAPHDAIKEMARILKPDGKLIISDLDEHHFEFLQREHHDRWLGFKRQDIRQWLRNAGLKDVVVDCVGEDCCAESSCGSENAKINVFMASGRK
jgi:ubiquinone/menaquinone biosynthesis C-methylase UbiE